MSNKIFLFLIFILRTSILNAQDEKEQSHNLSNTLKETFYVTGKDKIREGPYTLTNRGVTVVRGFYKSGNKDSVWIYTSFGNNLVSKQYYKDGKRTGIWEFYDIKNVLKWTYNFDSAIVHYVNPMDSLNRKPIDIAFQDDKGNWIYHAPDKHPLAINPSSFYYMASVLQYPDEAVTNHQQGSAGIAVLVDEQGNPVQYEIGISSGVKSLDKEALRIVPLMKLEFIPAENNGVKVKCLVIQTISFKLEQ